MKHEELIQKIIKAFYTVYNSLRYGFLDKVYENALSIELVKLGLVVQKQRSISVYYDEQEVGIYYADLIVNELVIIELKAASSIADEHYVQLLNYLKATNMEVGLLLNFGKKPEIKRKIFDNEFK